MSISTATDGGVCLVCGDPLAPRSTAHCGDPDCRATVRAAKARVTYAAKHGVDLPLWEAIADADVGGTLPHFTLPKSGKGSADPLSTPKDAGLVFIYDNPGFSLHVGGDAGDNLRQSRVDDASLFDSSVPSLMVAPSDDRSGGLPLVYNGTTTPGMLVAVSSVEINDGGVIYSRTTYDRSPDADTSALAKLPNSNDPVTLGNDATVSSWQVNQRAHGLPADVYAFSADALIAAAGDDYDPADIFSAANIAAGLSDPFGFMVDALSDSADAAKVRALSTSLIFADEALDVDATAVYGIASAFTMFTTPDGYVWHASTPESFAADLANPVPPSPIYLGTIDDKMALHNEVYADEHAVIARWLIVPKVPKVPKVLPPLLSDFAVIDSAKAYPAKLKRAHEAGHVGRLTAHMARYVDADGCWPGTQVFHDCTHERVPATPAAGDPHILLNKGQIPVSLPDALEWGVGGRVTTSADYVTPQPAGYPADHYPAAPGPVVDTTLVLCASLPPGAGQQTPRPLTSWHVKFDGNRLPALLVPRRLTPDTYVHDAI